MYAVVAAPDKKEQIMSSIGDTVVFSEFGSYDRDGLKGVFEKVLRIPLDALIVDADAGPGEVLLNAVKTYRTRRPSTRIVLLAPGRTPGDRLVASLVHRGVFDIIASEDWAERLKNVLERTPADYSAVARWDAQSADGEENAVKKGLFKRFAGAGKAKRSIVENADNKVSKPINGTASFFFPVPSEFAWIDKDTELEIGKLFESSPAAVLVSSERKDLLEIISSLRREGAMAAVPLVVVGNCDAAACYTAGADECVEVLDEQATGRIKARAVRMKELWSKAVKDDLTGLFKRQFLDDYLADQVRRYSESGVTFSIIMADLDHFKKINDTYGHQAGDVVLKEFSKFILSNVRKTDIVARYGGEEFVIVFSGLDYANAFKVTDKLRKRWETTSISIPEGKRINSTFTAGVAEYGIHAADINLLLKTCDEALYAGKSAGRNIVTVAGESIKFEKWVYTPSPHLKESKKKILTLLSSRKNENVITVVSGPGGGKTTIAVNLAVTLALRGCNVAFIDGDLESLAAHHFVGGVPYGRTLVYALEKPSEAPELLELVPFVPQLYTLTADPDFEEVDIKLFNRLPDVIRKVSPMVDMVVVDTPPEFKKARRLVNSAGRTVIVVSPDEILEDMNALKLPKPVLVLNRWPAGLDVSLGEGLWGMRASCVIPELSEIQEAEQGGVPAVLGCGQLYRALNAVAGKFH